MKKGLLALLGLGGLGLWFLSKNNTSSGGIPSGNSNIPPEEPAITPDPPNPLSPPSPDVPDLQKLLDETPFKIIGPAPSPAPPSPAPSASEGAEMSTVTGVKIFLNGSWTAKYEPGGYWSWQGSDAHFINYATSTLPWIKQGWRFDAFGGKYQVAGWG